ncbi:hypothetical protein B296_00043457 [Ensete ventricosum]|uniref:Uncharacterized protein n=1 Tax=Ensete ventricosum TaxID=4639 RepID=A0A426XWY0_ENSVE|nr:hypothetical protein B296_00043457 [Ensete ventricosum]
MQYKYAKVILLTSGFLSILIEILFYIMQVYEVTDKKISLIYIKGYSKLSKIEKIVWYDPGFSTFHALVAAALSFYLIVVSDLFKNGTQEEI